MNKVKKVVITGSEGFIGNNLTHFFKTRNEIELLLYKRGDSENLLRQSIYAADFIIHLAGENRPNSPDLFSESNKLTSNICNIIKDSNRKIPLLFSSSIKVHDGTNYGISKKICEDQIYSFSISNKSPALIYRLPGVFGKWCKPHYNSVVATFCNNIALNKPIQINDQHTLLNLVYIDDLVIDFYNKINDHHKGVAYPKIIPEYKITIDELAKTLYKFRNSRETLLTERVGSGLFRALYSTYLSYLPPSQFSYEIPTHQDSRGIFVELLKTPDCGQFSFFTAEPGVTRGGHYHNSKTEKFLVISGNARYRFRNIATLESHEIISMSDEMKIVESIPGWVHDITNIGLTRLVVLVWANEIYDPINHDTYNKSI